MTQSTTASGCLVAKRESQAMNVPDAPERRAKFAQRKQQVLETRSRRARRHRQYEVIVLVAFALIALSIGALSSGMVGAGIGAGAVGFVWSGRRLAARAARKRGASAWDWMAQRYRLLGDPAARVQQLDSTAQQRRGNSGLDLLS